ncbi:hypothetical protein K0M31_017958 [Melipona bicolor]|uniref:SGF29 C-terminal domain-containing protein n=1 Tax=Melipona bicolor TaxID=60889 RepID=A0AA40KSW6_9HYME|nr:hypothetical protein K0M31_017958 [Melipona bicolor]
MKFERLGTRDGYRLEMREGNKETIRRGALMKMVLSSAQTIPLYVGKTPGAKPPALCGAIPAEPTYIAKMGEMVAAFVKGSEEEDWILAEVVQFNPLLPTPSSSTNKNTIRSGRSLPFIDEEQKGTGTSVSRRRVVPLH